MTRGRPVKRRKRGDGEGSITKAVRSGITYWRVRVTLPDGTRSQAKYFKTLDSAKEALLQMRTEIAQGAVPSDITFAEWSERWLLARRGVKPKSISEYTRNISKAFPYFGSKQLTKVAPRHIELMIIGLLDSGLSSSTVRTITTNVCATFTHAYRHGLTSRDIGSLVTKPSAATRDVVILSRNQWQVIIDSSRASARGLIVEFVIKTGMRINEALSMTWDRADMDTSTVTVGRSKTEAGAGRNIPVDSSLVARLRQLRAEHGQIQLAQPPGVIWNDDDLVFCNSTGNRQSYQNLQKRVFTPMLKEAGLPHMTWHHLRYNAGSYLISEGVPITAVSKILGHANPAITMRIYAKVLVEDLEQVRTAMEKFG